MDCSAAGAGGGQRASGRRATRAPSAGSLLQVLLGLVVVLLLMAAVAWLMKRFGMARTAANSAVKIVGGVSVGNRERVLVLEVADQWIVVGVAAGRVSALANMPRQEHIAETATGAAACRQFFRMAEADHRQAPWQSVSTPNSAATPSRRSALTRYWLPLALLCLPLLAGAQQAGVAAGLPALSSTPTAGGGQSYTLSLQTLLLLTALSFLPAVLLMMTSFTRIIIVLSILRQAIGTQGAPPNQVLVGLALFLTLFVMGPVFDTVYSEAYQPLSENKITLSEALDKGVAPLKAFMMKQTRQSDLALYVKLSNSAQPQGPEEVSLRVLVPAFITSELKTAFQISFAIFIPFLIIDMVVASVLMSMGMMMVSPAIVSLPFKLMLFVLVDGWQLLIGSLAQSFY